ncbi:MAG: DUF554 domain-containing protein [Christensenellales bacterium]
MPLTGTLVNAAAILVGGLTGYIFRKKLPQKYLALNMNAVALVVLMLGMQYALQSQQLLCLMISILCGTALGTMLRLHDRLSDLGDWLKDKLKAGDGKFAEGFVTSVLLFCTGAMAVTGAIQSGMSHDHSTLLLKAVMDGVISIFLTSAMGLGVLFSALAVLIYQGVIALGAHALSGVMAGPALTEITAVGGILLIALGLTMLEVKQFRVSDMLPSIFLPIAFLPLINLLVNMF